MAINILMFLVPQIPDFQITLVVSRTNIVILQTIHQWKAYLSTSQKRTLMTGFVVQSHILFMYLLVVSKLARLKAQLH